MTQRVLHVVESLDRGGMERVVCDLVLEQRRAGIEAEVFCLFNAGAFADELTTRGIPVYEGGKRLGVDFKVARKMRDVARRTSAQLLHTHNMVANYYAAMALLLPPSSTPIINTRHNMGTTGAPDPRERWFRWSVHRTRLVAHVCQKSLERFVEDGTVPPGKARMVHNGIPLDRYAIPTPADRADARRDLGCSDADLLVGCVGRLEPVKNHASLIQALAALISEFPILRLVLIGDGSLRPGLEREAARLGVSDHVVFAGERADVPRLLSALDFFALPSLSEGHSIALLEACAVGLPIVATDVGGNPEIITPQRGLLAATTANSIADRLRQLLRDRALAQRLGASARDWAREHVSARAMCESYRHLYNAVAQ